MGQLFFIPSEGGGGSSQTSDVYLSEFGNDSNDGLTVLTPVATWARAWDIVAGDSTVVVHLVGTVDGYTPPDNDWTIITGGENFTEVATGVAGAATTALQLELDTPVAVDAFRHFTIEFTDGAAAGYRRTVRDNAATIAQYVCVTGGAVPAPGDSYRILRPSARIGIVRQEGSTVALVAAVGNRLDVVNAAWFSSDGVTRLVPAEFGIWFGVDIEGSISLLPAGASLIAGADTGVTFSIVNTLYEALGIPRNAQNLWNGWGLSFSSSTIGAFSSIGTVSDFTGDPTVYFIGFITAGSITMKGTWDILGGSACRLVCNGDSFVVLRADGTSTPQPILLRCTNAAVSAIIVENNARLQIFSVVDGVCVTIESGANSNSAPIIYGFYGSYILSSSRINITGTGTSTVVRAWGDFNYVPNTLGVTTPWATPSAGFVFDIGPTGRVHAERVSSTCVTAIRNAGGDISFETGVSSFTCSGQAIVQTAGLLLFNIGVTFAATLAGGAAALIQGGMVSQLAGVLSITNLSAAANSDALAVRNGAVAGLSGGANTVLNAAAAASGFGCNARFGGRVYFNAQPSSVVGVTADLTVGTAGGEDQPDTFLAASGSGLANTFGNVIARAA